MRVQIYENQIIMNSLNYLISFQIIKLFSHVNDMVGIEMFKN